MRTFASVIVALACLHPLKVEAQEAVTIGAEFLFYGDNTEFSNPFREGETLLGNSGRFIVAADVSERVRLTGGVFGDHRYGSDNAFQTLKPVFTLSIDAGASRFTFGTLTLPQMAFGPDRGGPHGLLPPIQRETLALTRPYEAGLQWTYRTPRVEHEFWLAWQRLNTPAGREAFDVGTVGRVALRRRVSLGYQAHIVHHGGQLHATGPVSDSWVAAPGVIVNFGGESPWKGTLEGYGLVSRHVPDREEVNRTTTGAALFTRAALERHRWRGHMIVWRGNDYLKEEGDPNYGALRLNGTRHRKARDYAEAGLTRTAAPVRGLLLEGSARLHRIENHYEYSFRILGRVTLYWRVR